MKNLIILLLLILSACILSACAGDSAPSESPGDVATRNVESRQKLAAAQTEVALANQASARATANAIATDRAMTQRAQATEQAFNLQQRQAAATATIQAVQLQATIVAQNAQATAEARSAAATASAIEAKATADAREIAANLEKIAATATAQSLQLTQIRADEEAARAKSDAEFYNGLWRAVAIVVIVLALIGGMMLFSTWLTSFALRTRTMESRAGTFVFVGSGKQGFTPQLVGLPDAPRLMPGDESEAFDKSQAQTIDAESTFVFHHGGKTELLHRPTDESETERRLVLRLLRESAQLNGWNSDTIATAKELKWSGDTRNRAIDLIRDYIVTKEGRNGGTFIGSRHKTLLQLYSDVGGRRVILASQHADVAESAKLTA